MSQKLRLAIAKRLAPIKVRVREEAWLIQEIIEG